VTREYAPRGAFPYPAPVLDFAGLAAHLAGGTTAQIGPDVVIRRYGTDPKAGLPPVISVEYRGVALAFVRPDSVRFPGWADGALPGVRLWLARVVADNGLGTGLDSVRVSIAPGIRRRTLAIDGDRHRLLAGETYQVPEQDTEQETAS
jgi:hypothetical protein